LSLTRQLFSPAVLVTFEGVGGKMSTPTPDAMLIEDMILVWKTFRLNVSFYLKSEAPWLLNETDKTIKEFQMILPAINP
jgi:hypothetical protein